MILKSEKMFDKKFRIYDGQLPELKPVTKKTDSQLQRTEQWFKDKTGMFSGSEIKKLISCGRSTAKMSWDRPEKIIDFSDTAKNYIFGKAMERKTGIFVQQGDNFNFKYGRQAEPIIVAKFKEKMPQIKTFKEEPFILVKGHEKYLGASPDGSMIGIITDGEKEYGFEAKGAMSWETLGARVRKPFDDKHIDFWQIQLEMMALGVDSLFYCISHPAEKPYEFINAEYDEAFAMINDIEILEVKASPIHQEVITKRAQIAYNAILLFLDGMNFDEAIQQSCTNFNLNKQPEPVKEIKHEISRKDLPF